VKWYQDNFGFEVSVNNGENFAMLMIAPGVPFFINKASGEITTKHAY
jgi:hypothetical protein